MEQQSIEELLGVVTPETKKTEAFDVAAIANGELPPEPAWKRVQAGDKTAESAVLRELDGTIRKAINAYAAGDSAYLTQARVMALDAVRNYDPNRGAQLSSYVYGQLQPLRRVAAQRGNLTHIPENAALERNSIQKAIRNWEADHDSPPTTEDLATLTGLSKKRIDALMNYKPVVAASVAVSPEGDSMGAYDVNRALELYDEVIYNELDDIDKKIYEWMTGYGKGEILSGVEIARRLNITPAAVSKRYHKISQKFAEDREVIRRSLNIDVEY